MTVKIYVAAFIAIQFMTGCLTASPEPSDNRNSSSFDKKVERKSDQIIDRTTDRAVNKVGNTLESKMDQMFNRLF